MSITPFLTGLPVSIPGAVPTDLGSLADGSDTSGGPGDPGSAFGEALAAALLVAPAPAAVVEPAATPVESGLAPVESRLAPVDSWVAPVESGLASIDAAAPATEPTTPARTTPDRPAPTAAPIPGPLDAVAAAPAFATPDPASTTHNSTGTGHDSTSATHDSTGARPESTSGVKSMEQTEPATVPAAAARTADADPAGTTPQPATQPAQPAAAVAGPAGSSAGAPVALPTPTVERAVVQQVFPEVTRFVATTPTDRPGTHRITLTLQPEQLGEVRVTLIVKDGAVQVRLAGNADDAAGNAAVHRALSSGATELQRLLERGGATEARVLVRDPSTTDTGQQGQSPQGWTSGDSGRSGAREQWSGQPGQPGHPAYRTASSDAGPGAGSDADPRTDQRAIPRATPLTARSTGLLDRTI